MLIKAKRYFCLIRSVLIKAKKFSVFIGISIIECMYTRPVASVSLIAGMTGLSVQTVNKAVGILLSDGILKEVNGNRRSRVFTLHDYIRVFKG